MLNFVKKNTTNNHKCDDESNNCNCLNCNYNKDCDRYFIKFVSNFIDGHKKQILISKIVPQKLKDSINEITSFF